MGIYALSNQKGGSTKTATTLNLAATISRAGRSVLVVDLDPQANATTGLGINPTDIEFGANDVLAGAASFDDAVTSVGESWPLVSVLAGSKVIANREADAAMDIQYRLRNALAGTTGQWDHILIDTGPFVGRLMANGLAAAEHVIIATDASPDGVRGCNAIVESVEIARRSFNEQLAIRSIVIGRREKDGDQDFREEELRNTYGTLVAKTVIPKRSALRDAHGLAVPIHTLTGRGPLAISVAYRDLAAELDLI